MTSPSEEYSTFTPLVANMTLKRPKDLIKFFFSFCSSFVSSFYVKKNPVFIVVRLEGPCLHLISYLGCRQPQPVLKDKPVDFVMKVGLQHLGHHTYASTRWMANEVADYRYSVSKFLQCVIIVNMTFEQFSLFNQGYCGCTIQATGLFRAQALS